MTKCVKKRCLSLKYRVAGGNATPGRNAFTQSAFFQNIGGQCYTRTRCVQKGTFLQNTGPPEAMLRPDEMLYENMCVAEYRATGGNATPGRKAFKQTHWIYIYIYISLSMYIHIHISYIFLKEPLGDLIWVTLGQESYCTTPPC